MSTTVTSSVSLVATGSITVSAPNVNLNFAPYSGGMLLFANIATSNTGLNFSGSTGTWKGILYAPHSNLRYSGSQNLSSAGSMVGYTISITGSNGHLAYDPSIFPPPSTAEIILYE